MPRPPSHSRRGSSAGFSLVEVLIAFVVLVVALLGAVTSITSSALVGGANRESSLAYQAGRAMLERLQTEPFELVFARYDADTSDDPDGTAPGMHFFVPGLDVQANDADGFCGRVVLPANGPELFENTVDAALGLPLDLNADGVIDALDHAADAVLLPVAVEVAWTGASGDRVARFTTVLGARR
jgi:type II secretory pathway pseudopilin PulG